MKKLILVLVLCAAPVLAQNVIASSSANDTIAKGVKVTFNCEVPAADPYIQSSKVDAAMAPVKSVWLWGDEEAHAKQRNFTEAAYGETISHTYLKPGTYGVTVIVLDSKKRLIREESIQIRINLPFEVVSPAARKQEN